MSRRAFLVRPHPFVVEAMTGFLKKAQFEVKRVTNAADLDGVAGSRLGVISLAVNAEAALSISEAWKLWQATCRGEPVLFSGLAGRESAQLGLEAELGRGAPRLVSPKPGLTLTAQQAPYVTPNELQGSSSGALEELLARLVRA
ncbi:MAG: hypothetical protein U0228_31870 [Myxococcaceae bacterium]